MRQDVQRRPADRAREGLDVLAGGFAGTRGTTEVVATEAEQPVGAIEAWALAPSSHKLFLVPLRTEKGRGRGRGLLDM